VRELIRRGVDVDAQRAGGETALMTATTRGNIGIVKQLLEKGASTEAKNHWGNTALHLSAIYGNSDIARALLEAGASMTAMNKEGYDARGLALKNRQEDFLKLLDAAEQSRFAEDLKDFSDGLDREVTVKNPVNIRKPSAPPRGSFHHIHRRR
jgi:ankyrin repeat protein